MDQLYYEQVRDLKRQGKYDECIKIYLQHLNDEEADASFYDGLAKIYMLAGDFNRARLCLLAAFKRTYAFRGQLLKKILDKKLEDVNEILSARTFEEEMSQAMKVYELFSNIGGEDHSKATFNSLGLSKIELTMCYCECFDDTYFRYYFCLACQGKVPYRADALCSELLKAKNAILNTFKGVATQQERVEYERVYQCFKNGGNTNKYALIFSVLPDFANYLKTN